MKNWFLSATTVVVFSCASYAQDLMQPVNKKPIPQMTDNDVSKKSTQADTANVQNESDPRVLIEKAADALDKLKSLRLHTSIINASGEENILYKTSIVNPGRSHTRSYESEMLEIGSVAWKREAGGEWTAVQKTGNGIPSDLLKMHLSFGTPPAISISEESSGKTVLVVYSLSGNHRISGEPLTTKVWIGKADGLPRRVEAGNVNSSTKMVTTFYDFNAPITINPPKR